IPSQRCRAIEDGLTRNPPLKLSQLLRQPMPDTVRPNRLQIRVGECLPPGLFPETPEEPGLELHESGELRDQLTRLALTKRRADDREHVAGGVAAGPHLQSRRTS